MFHRLMSEIRDLMRHPAEGIEYIENEDGNSLSEIHALITGPGKYFLL
jgi:ubiquitin-protein ligase